MRREKVLGVVFAALVISFGTAVAAPSKSASRQAHECDPMSKGARLCDEGLVEGWMSCAYTHQPQLCPPLKQ